MQMKRHPVKSLKPGDVDGKRGDWFRRFHLNGCVWHQHMKDIKDDKGNIIRSHVVGLELVSSIEHWWLDKKIKRPELQQGDWDFSPLKDSVHEWQLPWAWQYECWREWQPWSDFVRWRKDWRKEAKRLRDPSTDWICGKRTREEAERDAAFSYGGQLPLWLLRDFRDYFPDTPWVKIPLEKRKTLEHAPLPGSVPIALEGSLLDLKESDPNSTGLPPNPVELCIQHEGVSSLRQPDPNNEAEKAVYAEYRRKWSEALERQKEWSDTTTPGLYRHEVVKEITPGQFVGTYIIYIPWYHTDDDLKAGFAAWLKKRESELGLAGCRKKFSRTGWDKRYADLKQLGALRLLRKMTAEAAIQATGKVLRDKNTDPYPLFGENPTAWYRARRSADGNLQGFFGVT